MILLFFFSIQLPTQLLYKIIVFDLFPKKQKKRKIVNVICFNYIRLYLKFLIFLYFFSFFFSSLISSIIDWQTLLIDSIKEIIFSLDGMKTQLVMKNFFFYWELSFFSLEKYVYFFRLFLYSRTCLIGRFGINFGKLSLREDLVSFTKEFHVKSFTSIKF